MLSWNLRFTALADQCTSKREEFALNRPCSMRISSSSFWLLFVVPLFRYKLLAVQDHLQSVMMVGWQRCWMW